MSLFYISKPLLACKHLPIYITITHKLQIKVVLFSISKSKLLHTLRNLTSKIYMYRLWQMSLSLFNVFIGISISAIPSGILNWREIKGWHKQIMHHSVLVSVEGRMPCNVLQYANPDHVQHTPGERNLTQCSDNVHDYVDTYICSPTKKSQFVTLHIAHRSSSLVPSLMSHTDLGSVNRIWHFITRMISVLTLHHLN